MFLGFSVDKVGWIILLKCVINVVLSLFVLVLWLMVLVKCLIWIGFMILKGNVVFV